MSSYKQILSKLNIKTLRYIIVPVFFVFILITYPHQVFAMLYQPGQTLNPTCLPTDTNCGVAPPLVLSKSTAIVTATAAAFVATSSSASIFPYASTTAVSVSGGNASTSSLTLGTLSGIMKAVNGVVTSTLVSLSSDITGVLAVIHGGTGTSTAPTYGKVLLGNSSGTYDLVATSSLGISSSGGGTPGGASNQIQFNNNGIFGASSLLTFNSNTLNVQGTASSTNLVIANNATLGTVIAGVWKGTKIGVGYGGTGSSTPSDFLFGDGNGNLTSTSTIAQNYIDTALARTSNVLTLTNWFATTTAPQLKTLTGLTNLVSTNATLYTASVGALTATSSLSSTGNTTLATTAITGSNTLTVGTGLTSLGGSATIAGTLNVTSTTTLNNLAMNSTRITGLATPTGINDATNKAYVDAIAQGISWQPPVVAIATTTAPLTPATGDRYVILSGASGFGSCTLNQIAKWSGSAWVCSTPSTGWSVYVNQVATNYNFNGTTWVSLGSTINHANLFGLQGGQTGQYYHLNKTNYNDITNSKAQLSSLLSVGAPSFAGLTITGSSTRSDSLNVVGKTIITGGVSVSATTTTNGLSATFANLVTSTITNLTSSIAKLASATITNLTGTNATLYTASIGALTATSSLVVNGQTTLTNASSTNQTVGGYFTVAGNTTLANASTTQLSVSGPAYFNASTTFNGIGYLFPSADGTANQILSTNSEGGLSWETVSSSGGGYWATTTDNLIVHPTNTSYVTVIGASATTTTGNILEIKGDSLFDGSVVVSGKLTATGHTTLATASSTSQTVSGYLNVEGQTTLGNASTTQLSVSGIQWITPLATPAGTFLAVNANGQVIATTTPAGGTGGVGTGTQGQLTFYNANGKNLTATSTIFLTQNGNIGIGTTTPASKLDVAGPSIYFGTGNTDSNVTLRGYNSAIANITTNAGYNATYNGIGISSNPSNSNSLPAWGVDIGGNENVGSVLSDAFAINRKASGGNWANLFTIDSSGNVGIGTTTPSAKLGIQGGIGVSPHQLYLASNGNIGIGTTTATKNLVVAGADAKIMVTGTIGAAIQLRKTGTLNAWSEWQQTGLSTRLNNGNLGGDVVTILNTGKVGLGVANPKHKLSVNGVIAGQPVAQSGDVLLIGNDSKLVDINVANTAGLYGIEDSTVGALKLGSGGGTIFGNGNDIGIGIAVPATKFQVLGDVRIGASSNRGCMVNYSGTWLVGTCSSDARLKTITGNITGILGKLSSLNLVNYYWNNTAATVYHDATTTLNTGFVAQDVQKVFPKLVSTDDKGYKRLNYTTLEIYGLEATKELNNGFTLHNLALGATSTIASWYAGTTTPAISVIATGNVGIGTTTPYSRLTIWGPDTSSATAAFTVSNNASTTEFQVDDNGNAFLAGSLSQNSDRRLKKNIKLLSATSSLASIVGLTPVNFNWEDSSKSSVTQLGFIAQDVQQIFPNIVSTTSATALTPNGTLSLNYIGLISPIVASIKDLATQVSDFTQSITTKVLTAVTGKFTNVSAKNISTQELCVGNTCINQSQLKVLLRKVGQTATVSSAPVVQVNIGTSTTTTSFITTPPASTTPTTATSTPKIPPIITLSTTSTTVIVGDVFDPLSFATVDDKKDGDITSSIKVSSTVSTSTPGTYKVTFNVSDSQGLSATPKTLTVIVKLKPVVVPVKNQTITASTTPTTASTTTTVHS